MEELIAALEARASRRAALAAMGLAGAGMTLAPAAVTPADAVAEAADAVESEKGKRRCRTCCNDRNNRQTMLQFLHASPASGEVDIWLEGLLFFENVPFGGVTGLTRMPNYQFTVTVTEPGAGLLAPIFEQEIKLDTCTSTEFAIVVPQAIPAGLVAPLMGAVYPIDREPTAKAGAARFSAVHLVSGAPAVDIVTSDGKALVRNLQFGAASEPRLVRPGVHDLQVRLAGTTEVVYAARKVEMIAGRSSQFHVMGGAGGSGFSSLASRYVTCCSKTSRKRRKKK